MPFLLKKVVWISVLTLACLASSAGYGCQSAANAPVRFPSAYVQDDCGPTDGLVVKFYFTRKQSECGKYEEPFIIISINENLPKSAPQDYSIRSGRWAMLASRCLKAGQCESATSGSLKLRKFIERQGASGEYELHFHDGSVEKGSFNAMWCPGPRMCG